MNWHNSVLTNKKLMLDNEALMGITIVHGSMDSAKSQRFSQLVLVKESFTKKKNTS